MFEVLFHHFDPEVRPECVKGIQWQRVKDMVRKDRGFLIKGFSVLRVNLSFTVLRTLSEAFGLF